MSSCTRWRESLGADAAAPLVERGVRAADDRAAAALCAASVTDAAADVLGSTTLGGTTTTRYRLHHVWSALCCLAIFPYTSCVMFPRNDALLALAADYDRWLAVPEHSRLPKHEPESGSSTPEEHYARATQRAWDRWARAQIGRAALAVAGFAVHVLATALRLANT